MLQKLTKGQLDWHDPLNQNVDVISDIFNRRYKGRDLTEVHALEINAAFSGDKWAWIQNRINTENYEGILVKDYIPTQIGNVNHLAEILGIDTYKNYGNADNIVPSHIDFQTRDVHPTERRMNPVNFNNGTTVSPNPWTASELYAWMNALQMQVPNAAAANPAMVNVDFRSSGLLNQLEPELRAVMAQKRAFIPRRFTAGQLLIDDNSWDWRDIGFLWIPSEIEVYGTGMFGSSVNAAVGSQGVAQGGFVQYPAFAENMDRVKFNPETNLRAWWWLLSAHGGISTRFCHVNSNGSASHTDASGATGRVAPCFRIQKSA